jgi:two-component system OmpR family sensor kinase
VAHPAPGPAPARVDGHHCRTITAGDLSQGVAVGARTEVGQLGLALNTMLGEIEEAFQERDATERRLRQFLADASHELRTPLTSIQGFAELFRLGAARDRVDLAVILRRIEEEAARMKTLVEDLLLLARLDDTRPVRGRRSTSPWSPPSACSDAIAMAPDGPSCSTPRAGRGGGRRRPPPPGGGQPGGQRPAPHAGRQRH